jgi:hypothetical protein
VSGGNSASSGERSAGDPASRLDRFRSWSASNEQPPSANTNKEASNGICDTVASPQGPILIMMGTTSHRQCHRNP